VIKARTHSVRAAVIVGIVLLDSVAHADSVPPEAQAIFDHGRTLRLQGDCQNALPLFRRAQEVYPNGLGSLRNIAECEEAMGHLARAQTAWLELERALHLTKEARYSGWTDDAAQAATRLAPKLGTLTIQIHFGTPGGGANGRSVAPDVEVSVNGERLDPSLLGTPLSRDPGHYIVRAVSRAGVAAREDAVDLSAGEAKEVDVHLSAAVPDRAPIEPESRGARARDAAMWVAFGLGAASLVGAAVAEGERQAALGDRSDFLNACGTAGSATAMCNAPSAQSIRDRGNTAATWENVLFAAGAAGVATGVVIYALGHHASRSFSGEASRPVSLPPRRL
jgi:hypothetical protein